LKVTFPHMGNIYMAAKISMDGLGIQYVIPPFCSRKSLEIGSRISPEEMCLPFKIMMGNYVQSIQQGADSILLVGSRGPCRFGEYTELQYRLLKKAGYDVEFIVAKFPEDEDKEMNVKSLATLVQGNGMSKGAMTAALLRGLKSMYMVDWLERRARANAGYEMNPRESEKLYKAALKNAFAENNATRAYATLKDYKHRMEKVSLNKGRQPLKIAIIGEIYTIIEPFSNLNIEDKLTAMGVSTVRKLRPSYWITDTIMRFFHVNGLDVIRYAGDYLPFWIGGHARECVAEAVMADEKNFDGAIQIYPMGCMPEVVAKSILPSVSKDRDFPILTLVVDEMTGEAGYITRIEAFLDLLERRKKSCII
jgi:predicted nucleotide-binding protein (sugar kinase/HSP70/actin superfamily)